MFIRLLLLSVIVTASVTALADEKFGIPTSVAKVLTQSCVDCHGTDSPEGDIRLEGIAKLDLEARLELLNKVQEQLYLKRMPPKDEAQPTEADRT